MDGQKWFEGVEDFRLNRRKKHERVDMLVIALCAIVSGADDFEEIEAYGRGKATCLSSFLALPTGIPSHLSEWSVANRSNSIDVPDFTAGSWEKNPPVDITLRGVGSTKVRV